MAEWGWNESSWMPPVGFSEAGFFTDPLREMRLGDPVFASGGLAPQEKRTFRHLTESEGYTMEDAIESVYPRRSWPVFQLGSQPRSSADAFGDPLRTLGAPGWPS